MTDRLNLIEAAQYLGMSRWTLRRWLKQGLVAPTGVLPTGRRWFSTSDLDAMLGESRKSA